MSKPICSSLDQISSVAHYLRRIGAEIVSLRRAIIRETHGSYWKDVAVIRFDKDGNISTPADYPGAAPTEQEQKDIINEFKQYDFPEVRPIVNIGSDAPEQIRNAAAENLFVFRNTDNMIVMIQVRINLEKTGEKKYVPWTYWNDGVWRKMEPNGPLPIFNIEKLKNATTVFIHEGAKSAARVQEMIEQRTPQMKEKFDEHPWGRELSNAVHLGWIGGALNPIRTNWSAIKKAGVTRAFIVADNDLPGLSAIPIISRGINVPAMLVQFTDEWPEHFDLGDNFPRKWFKQIDDKERYIGPSFRACLHPATWATDLVPVAGSNKPVARLRDSFTEEWSYAEGVDLFVHNYLPEIRRSPEILNKILAPFSHVLDTVRVMNKHFSGRKVKLCYRPGDASKIISYEGTSAINMHIPSEIRPEQGNPAPWIEFLTYMFPREKERNEVSKWCATLIAKPDIRMHYAILLVSERQGVGKTTLTDAVLAPLVGTHNVSWPGENSFSDNAFNSWLSNKRLIIVSEIYQGHSWKSYTKMKNLIADRTIDINEKYVKEYTIENWAHFVACSNSLRALRIEDSDRRWFYPKVTEIPWPDHKFVEFRRWLNSGGLGIIKHWAECFGHYVSSVDKPPMTASKKELIDDSESICISEVKALADAIIKSNEKIAIFMNDIATHARSLVQGKIFDTDHELRKAMIRAGCYQFPVRVPSNRRLQYVILSPNAWRDMEETGVIDLLNGDKEVGANNELVNQARETIRQISKTAKDILEVRM